MLPASNKFADSTNLIQLFQSLGSGGIASNLRKLINEPVRRECGFRGRCDLRGRGKSRFTSGLFDEALLSSPDVDSKHGGGNEVTCRQAFDHYRWS